MLVKVYAICDPNSEISFENTRLLKEELQTRRNRVFEVISNEYNSI